MAGYQLSTEKRGALRGKPMKTLNKAMRKARLLWSKDDTDTVYIHHLEDKGTHLSRVIDGSVGKVTAS